MTTFADQAAFSPRQESVARPGYRLCTYTWPAPANAIKADVLLVHGLGEHARRYSHVASVLHQAGYQVHAYDHYGHGLSDGARGDVLTKTQLTDDLAEVLASIKQQRPVVLIGHSMGGLVVQRWLAQHPHTVDAAVLSSPALAVYTQWIDKCLLAVLPKLLPHLCVDNALKTAWLARDPQVVQAYKEDPLVHRKISALLAAWIVEEGHLARAQASTWQTPSLLMYAGQDKLVDPSGSQSFAQHVSAGLLQTHCFEAMYHEIFNDPEKSQVLDILVNWLNARFA